jgi:hypothetical protein
VESPQLVYNQSATQFALPLYLRPETEVDGRLIVHLAEAFLANLVFPGCRLTALHTKRAVDGANLNMGEFTAARWKSSVRKILNGEYAVVDIRAATPDFPNQKIWFSTHFNPTGGDEFLVSGTLEVKCSISYLRHLAASSEKVEALLCLAKQAWNAIDGGPAYGYGNLAIILARPRFDPRVPRPPGTPLPWEFIKPPEERAHAVPVAYIGNDIEGNLASLYCGGRGIKGAFWANFLSRGYVEMAGGEEMIRTKLTGLRVDTLDHGGLLIIATESPLPEDTPETRERFARLHTALQPAFLSLEQISENKRGMLGYFYRERPYEGGY